MQSSVRVPTGIQGLDELLSGGLVPGRVLLVIGGPGTGKTILSTQFIVNGIARYNENGLFISLDESKPQFYYEMSQFGWNLEKLEKENKFLFVDASPIRTVPGIVKLGELTIGKREFSLLSLIEIIRKNVEKIGARRLALDSLASLAFQHADPFEVRTAVLDLIEALIETGVTCIITNEMKIASLRRVIQPEEYLAQGVIILQSLKVGKDLIRAIQVEKMRGSAIDTQLRPYKITERGIEVYPKETVF
ncbi:MAG: ATPase domain-containing protein [Candidatus Bathyarchaeia archaeon]